ncbi:hypothetical protein [Nocardioides jishulii]|uniref:Uncharacterized protein n=1 Tax=Nocardioides jishulii TaxID=2575440 RepID=A0A4U2YJ29_9ACTN|nr:hypothetical protein [Nocardioides jishulii]QCX26678.1 hypothetical protein FCL41_03300 [Nocardioides jishulii]TKI60352.1 hypothetical protein FC770_16250 [Nocardioides jishulii]
MLRTSTALVAALITLLGWLGVAVARYLSPMVTVAPEHEIEPGGAFGIFFLLIAPYLMASLWVVPTGIAALVRPAAGWALALTMVNAVALCLFAVWMLVGGFEPYYRVFPWLKPYAALAAPAAVLGFGLAAGVATTPVTTPVTAPSPSDR